jgi:hypothetical protein
MVDQKKEGFRVPPTMQERTLKTPTEKEGIL